METNEVSVKKKERIKHWSLRKEMRRRIDIIGSKTDAADTEYSASLESVKKLIDIRNSRTELWSKIGQVVGTLAIGAAVAFTAFKIDNSDEIPRNKNSMNLFGRFFHL